MPFTGDVDVTEILKNLGDPSHGLRPHREEQPTEDGQERIYPATWGEPDTSTSVGLKHVPRVIWDVNGYYRSLGIQWPYRPTKLELRLGYQTQDGPNDERLTYYFKQLLQPAIRAAYDAMPLGQRFDDKYVRAENARKLAPIAAEDSRKAGKTVTISDLGKEFDEEEAFRLAVEKQFGNVRSMEYTRSSTWDWGYFRWKTRVYDPDRMEEWQRLLTLAFAEQGITTVIAIGYIGETEKEVVLKEFDGHQIFFLNENTQPTTDHAQTALSLFRSQKGTHD